MEEIKTLNIAEANRFIIDYFTTQLENLCFIAPENELQLPISTVPLNVKVVGKEIGMLLHINANKDKNGLLRYVTGTSINVNWVWKSA